VIEKEAPSDRDTPSRLLSVEGLAASYGGPRVLEGVTFDLRARERIGVLGPNGGGKSTLFRVLLGELGPEEGGVTVDAPLGFVPQTERSRLDYPVSALDVALMGALSRIPWWRPLARREHAVALEALARVGLRELASHRFGELSGGQRQRVLVARALVQDARILLLDEPFTGVDQPSSERLELLLDELAREGCGILIATHDLDQARGWDRVVCLNRQQIAFGRPDEVLTRDVLERTYGGAIITIGAADGQATAAILPPHHHHHD
jgi:ABC-type Mn2+/Zn2+ transport system ATPase subunit